MIPHYVIFIHGIGDEHEGFTRGLMERSQEEFRKTSSHLVSREPHRDGIDLKETVWSDITQTDQKELWRRLFPHMPKKWIGWTELLSNPTKWFPRLKYWSMLRRLVVNYQGDLIAYFPSSETYNVTRTEEADKYRQIHNRVSSAIHDAGKKAETRGATAGKEALLTVVAHSLGAVIASDLIYDMHEEKNGRSWPRSIQLANFITFGSPLALYNLRFGFSETAFRVPVRMQDPHGLWINVYDPQDVIGYPLKRLNDVYDQAVFADKQLNVVGQWWNPLHWLARPSPFSHLLYWTDKTVAQMIGRKAALDWLRKNQPDLEPMLKHEYEKYKSWVLGV